MAVVQSQIKGEHSPMDAVCIDTMRTLAMDAVQQANSGHPGAPMSLSPVGYCLWQRYLRYDPADPLWPNRDRFVLSNGHASMLLYTLLHLTGVRDVKHGKVLSGPSLPIEELKRFRQLGSRTPGHPESHITPGVETTTGPLGQGVANAVGMAIAGRWLAARYNKPGFEKLFDFKVYAICGDGCMMEGIASEASSLAAHQKLANLCLIYDSNRISIEGHTTLAFTEDVGARFRAYGWNVLYVKDANDIGALGDAIQLFQKTTDRPTFIVVDSIIGWGAPHKQDTKEAHGEPLGEEEVKLAKRFYGWPEDAKFLVPDGVYDHFKQGIGQRGKQLREAWSAQFQQFKAKYPELAKELELMESRDLPAGWDKDIPVFPADAKGLATRESSSKVESAIAKNVPWLLGGSADLAPSTKTLLTFEGAGNMQADTPGGRNMHFGVREHAMGGIINGMSLTKVRPYGAVFLIFSDYGRGSIRLGALSEIPVIYIFTHDSIGVGEDGPTHQPIEHLASLRAIPNIIVIRPGDANEVSEAWRFIMQLKHQPALLILSRQAMPTLDRTKYAPAAGLAKGAYTLLDAPDGKPDVILIGTGTEVQLCTAAQEQLAAAKIKARIVSMPAWQIFEQQTQNYRDSVLPPSITARVSVEMASVFGWERYTGSKGSIIGMRSFGASAPIKDLLKHFGFTVDAVVAAAKKQVG
jgi:transketolase